MSPFAQSPRQAQILILEILQVFLRLEFSPFLTLDKIERFETASDVCRKTRLFTKKTVLPASPNC